MTEATMIERIARTLCRLDGHPEDIRFERGLMWESYEAPARAILTAMREPSGKMVAAVASKISSEPCLIYRAMIEAALGEKIL